MAFTLGFIIAGCGLPFTDPAVEPARFPPVPAGQVHVLTRPPQNSYQVINSFKTSAGTSTIQKRAGDMGGHAVILIRPTPDYSEAQMRELWRQSSAPGSNVFHRPSPSSDDRVTAIVIRYQ